MISKKWLLLALGLLTLLAVAALIASAPDKQEPVTTNPEDGAESPNVVGSNVSFVVTEGERKKWKLVAEKAYYFEDQSGARLEKVHGEFYSPDGEPILKFTAPEGNYRNSNNAVVLTGGVVASSLGKSQGELRAPRMVWNAHSKEVTADGGNVVLKFPQGVSRANRCRFTLDFSMVSLEGGVLSEISSPQ